MTRNSIRTAAALALCALASLAAAGPAAADIRIFKATAEGSGSYDRYDESRDPAGELSHQDSIEVSFSWRVTIPRVVFDSSGQLVSGSGLPVGTLSASGTHDFVAYGRSGGAIVRTPGQCVAAPAATPYNDATIEPDPSPPSGGEEGTHVVLRPFPWLRLPASCSGALANLSDIVVWSGKNPAGAFDHRFTLPKEAVDAGKVIQHVEQTPAQKAACAGRSHWTHRCTLDWSGKVTFELVEVIGTDGPTEPNDVLPPLNLNELLPPLDPGPGDPDEELLLPIAGALSRDGSRATVKVTCPAGCKGSVRAYKLGAVAARNAQRPLAARKARRPLAARHFKARPSRPTTVTLRFRGSARRAVHRAGGVRVVVAVGRNARRSLVLRSRR